MGNKCGWAIISIVSALHWFKEIDGDILFTLPDDQQWRTPADAQTWCTRNQSKLLEVTSDSLQSSVVTFINNARSQNRMTGNNVITNGKRFRNSTFAWVNGRSIGSSLQIYGQDKGIFPSFGYLNSSLSGNAFIADTPTVTRGYICEGTSLCTDGFKLNGRCYKSYSDTLSWFGARNRCIDGGGDLASFEFIVDAQGFSALNGSGLNQPTYWVGLRRQWWTWQGSNSDARYSQWSDGHPNYGDNQNNECLCLRPYDWKWIECNCGQAYQFFCLTETESTRISSSSSSTSVGTVYISSSTRITTSTTKSQPANSPSSFSNPEHSSTTTTSRAGASTVISASVSTGVSEDVSAGVSAGQGPADYKLPVGLGVGLGGGVLIAAIIVILIVLVKRKEYHRKSGLEKPSSDPPDVTPESYYATVLPKPEYENIAMDIDVSQIPPPIEYADLNIVAMSQSPYENEQICRSVV